MLPVAVIVILAGVVVVASGRGGEMAPEYPDYPPIDLGPVSAADVALLRPPSAAWGYNMRVTDEALDTIARAVTERDIKISALQQEVSDLREELAHDWTRQSGAAATVGAPGAAAEAERPEAGARSTEPVRPRTKRTRPRAPNGLARRGLNLSRPSRRRPSRRRPRRRRPRRRRPRRRRPRRRRPRRRRPRRRRPRRRRPRRRRPRRRRPRRRRPRRRHSRRRRRPQAPPPEAPPPQASGARADRAAGRLGSSPSRTGAPSGALRQRVLRQGALSPGALLRRARSPGRTVRGLGRARWPGQLGRASPDARLGRGTPAGEGRLPRPRSNVRPPSPRTRPARARPMITRRPRMRPARIRPARVRSPRIGSVRTSPIRTPPSRLRPPRIGPTSTRLVEHTPGAPAPGPDGPTEDARGQDSPGPARRPLGGSHRSLPLRVPRIIQPRRSRIVSDGVAPGARDRRLRCLWGLSAPEYLAYHDDEWGRPLHGDQAIFERLCLEAFQSGLSLARDSPQARISAPTGRAVRHRRGGQLRRPRGRSATAREHRHHQEPGQDLAAAIANARAALDLPGGLSELVWKYAGKYPGEPAGAPQTTADIPAQTPASKALSAELTRNGFTFTGPVTAYATMQACGIVNDHLADCFRRTTLPNAPLTPRVRGSGPDAACGAAYDAERHAELARYDRKAAPGLRQTARTICDRHLHAERHPLDVSYEAVRPVVAVDTRRLLGPASRGGRGVAVARAAHVRP